MDTSFNQYVSEFKQCISDINERKSIDPIALKINHLLQDNEGRAAAKSSIFAQSIPGDTDLFYAEIANAVKILDSSDSQEAKNCARNLEELFPRPRPPLTEDAMNKLLSFFSPREVGQFSSVSSTQEKDNRLALIYKINNEKIPLLSLGFNSLQEAYAFFGEDSSKITFLDLSNVVISDADLQLIANHFRGVHHIIVFGSPITDSGLAHLKDMTLYNIEFAECSDITDAGLVHFEGMPLQTISFWGCNITPSAIEKLKQNPAAPIQEKDT